MSILKTCPVKDFISFEGFFFLLLFFPFLQIANMSEKSLLEKRREKERERRKKRMREREIGDVAFFKFHFFFL